MKRLLVPAAMAATLMASATEAQVRSGSGNFGFGFSGNNRIVATDGTPVLDLGMTRNRAGAGAFAGGMANGNRFNAAQFGYNRGGQAALQARGVYNGSNFAANNGQRFNGFNTVNNGNRIISTDGTPILDLGMNRVGNGGAGAFAGAGVPVRGLSAGVGVGLPLANGGVFRVGQVPTLGITAPSMMNGGGRTAAWFGPRWYR